MYNIKQNDAALYCRTAHKNDEAITHQENLLRQYAAEKGYDVYSCYSDNGISGTTIERPSLQKMFADIGTGKIKRVVILDISRLSRNLVKFYEMLEYFDQYGVELISIRDGFNKQLFETFAQL